MTDIDKINDKFFKKTFTNPTNVKTFLKIALPDVIKKRIDFSSIEIDPTDYISEEFREYFSDVVVKTRKERKKTLPCRQIFILYWNTRPAATAGCSSRYSNTCSLNGSWI